MRQKRISVILWFECEECGTEKSFDYAFGPQDYTCCCGMRHRVEFEPLDIKRAGRNDNKPKPQKSTVVQQKPKTKTPNRTMALAIDYLIKAGYDKSILSGINISDSDSTQDIIKKAIANVSPPTVK